MAQPAVADVLIDHQIDLIRYSNGVVRKVMGMLNRTDPDLFDKLTAAIARMGNEAFTVKRLDSLLKSVRETNEAVYQRVEKQLSADLRELTQEELGFHGELLERGTPAPFRVPLTAMAPEAVYAAAMATPFQGRLMSEWSESLSLGKMMRMRDAVRMGFVQGETISQIVKRVRGTKANGWSDGIIEIDRRNAEAVVRTAVSHVASIARENTYATNSSVVKALQWVSTLDGRTSPTCRLRDGLTYTLDHKPIGHSVSWQGGPGNAHWNCRSSSIPVLKTSEELGLGKIKLPGGGTRASDAGPVSDKTTYASWFKRQGAAKQDDIVGPTRGALYRKGGIEFTDFYNDKGKYLTLEELRESNAKAFKAAGM